MVLATSQYAAHFLYFKKRLVGQISQPQKSANATRRRKRGRKRDDKEKQIKKSAIKKEGENRISFSLFFALLFKMSLKTALFGLRRRLFYFKVAAHSV